MKPGIQIGKQKSLNKEIEKYDVQELTGFWGKQNGRPDMAVEYKDW